MFVALVSICRRWCLGCDRLSKDRAWIFYTLKCYLVLIAETIWFYHSDMYCTACCCYFFFYERVERFSASMKNSQVTLKFSLAPTFSAVVWSQSKYFYIWWAWRYQSWWQLQTTESTSVPSSLSWSKVQDVSSKHSHTHSTNRYVWHGRVTNAPLERVKISYVTFDFQSIDDWRLWSLRRRIHFVGISMSAVWTGMLWMAWGTSICCQEAFFPLSSFSLPRCFESLFRLVPDPKYVGKGHPRSCSIWIKIRSLRINCVPVWTILCPVFETIIHGT